jgi:hypothetical protein
LGPPLLLPMVYSTTSPSLRLRQPSEQWGPPPMLRHRLALAPLLPDPQWEPGAQWRCLGGSNRGRGRHDLGSRGGGSPDKQRMG